MVLDHDIVGVQKRPSWYTKDDKLWNIATSHNTQLDEIYNYMTFFFPPKHCWDVEHCLVITNFKFISSLFFMMSYPCYINTFVMLCTQREKCVPILYTMSRLIPLYHSRSLGMHCGQTCTKFFQYIFGKFRSQSLKKRSWFLRHSW